MTNYYEDRLVGSSSTSRCSDLISNIVHTCADGMWSNNVNTGQGGIEIENFVQSYHKNVCVMISWAALYRVHIGPTHVILLDIQTRYLCKRFVRGQVSELVIKDSTRHNCWAHANGNLPFWKFAGMSTLGICRFGNFQVQHEQGFSQMPYCPMASSIFWVFLRVLVGLTSDELTHTFIHSWDWQLFWLSQLL